MDLVRRLRAFRDARYLLGKNAETLQESIKRAGKVRASDFRIFIDRLSTFYDGVSLNQSKAFREAALAIADGSRVELRADEVLNLADQLARNPKTDCLGSLMQRHLGVKTWRNLIVGHVERHALTL